MARGVMANRWPSRVGERIGQLTILAHAGSRARYRIWRCRCDCGREEDVPGYRLSGPDRVTACAKCRAPICRVCGEKLARPTQSRTCGPICRRALSAILTQESRARLGPELSARRVAYNVARLAADPAARAAKQVSDRTYYHRVRADPDVVAKRHQRWAIYYDAMADDPAFREKQRRRTAEARRLREIELMRGDILQLEDRLDD